MTAIAVPVAVPETVAVVGTAVISPRSRLQIAVTESLRVVGQTVPVFIIATFVTFLLGVLSNQSPAASALGETATPADIARLNHEFGLDRPFIIQYVTWLGKAVTGDLGSSWFTHIPVTQSIAQRLPVSASIAGGALLIAILVGGTLGLTAALHRGKWQDRLVTGVSSFLSATPAFVAGIALILIFAIVLRIFPTGGYVPPEVSVTAWIWALILPGVSLSLDATADIARQLRTSLVAALKENYVLGAVVRGIPQHRIILTHVLRNAAGPALTVIGLHLPRLLGGAVVTEFVFSMPGLGDLAKTSALQGDVPVVQGSLFVAIFLVLVSNIAVNIALQRLRPGSRRPS